MIIIICIVLVVLIIFGILGGMYLEYKSFNKGICPKCGKHLIHFDTDSQGGRGYCCRKCVYFTWISYDWIDRNHRLKALRENNISEVYSNGKLVWKDDKITDTIEANLHQAKEDYESKYCNN